MLTRLAVVSLLLISFMPLAKAKNVYGYTVTKNNDTIYGTVKLSRFSLTQQTVFLSSYNMDELFDHVYFKPSTDKGFKEIFPTDISEFGFLLDHILYKYVSKEMKAKLGNNKWKFFLQVADGPINLFEIRWHINNQDGNINSNGMMVTEYYISGNDNEMIKVSQTDKDESVSDFLMKNLKLDKDILDKVTLDKTFKDVVEIARLYNNDTGRTTNIVR
jgi:hypothetical protein